MQVLKVGEIHQVINAFRLIIIIFAVRLGLRFRADENIIQLAKTVR